MMAAEEKNKVNSHKTLKEIENQIIESIENNEYASLNKIISKGREQIAKKFGEEAVELILESGNKNDKAFLDEAADVLFYYLLLINQRGYTLKEVAKKLKKQKRIN